ncbi:hypothetical protein MHK_005403 [Candidatus Magnetomorum sp. HK-1]|nr:hypothetical protein MHK_005403 [Candidatus Magnetomorum sp. HK-1]
MQENKFIQLDYQTLKKIDLHLESLYEKNYATNSKNNIGKIMAEVDLGSTQVRGLERLTLSSTRFSQTINYVKNQAGKEKKNKKKWSIVAEKLIPQLEELEKEAHKIGENVPATVLEVKMRLSRGLIKMIVANYYYLTKQDNESK